MKKVMVIIFLSANIFIFSQSDKKSSSYFYLFSERHFFDLSVRAGYSVVDKNYMGGNFGFNLCYMYAVTRYFALGSGYTLLFSIMYYDYGKTGGGEIFDNSGTDYILSMNITMQFMFGDLSDDKIAFLFDIGGGMIFTAKAGFYFKGLQIKAGYNMGGSDIKDFIFFFVTHIYHSVTLECGYMFNWE